MTYRDILVEMDGSPATVGRAQVAAALGARFKAHVTGVFAKGRIAFPFIPPEAFGLTPAEVQRIFDARDAAVRKAAEAAREIFESAAGAAGAESDWLEFGEDLQDLIACARRSDLTVASPDDGMGLSTADLAVAAGGPVLIVPPTTTDAAFGQHVLVAWNGSREAASALHAAWPFLEAAGQVDVLVVSHRGLGGPEGLLQRHFEHHGVRPNLIVDERDDAAAGDIIRSQAGALGADLVVMGFYGHSRLEERVLGGASREMLQHGSTPLLVCH